MSKPGTFEFETFNDGVCTICTIDEGGNSVPAIVGIRFSDRIIGAKRFYMAAQAQMQISRVIRLPQQQSLQYTHRVIIGDITYEIEQVQHISTTSPAVTDVTLRVLEMYGGDG